MKKSGFTLIELLLVIAIIAIMSVTVFVALDPVKRFRDARESRRYTDIETLLTAVHSYIIDTKGSLPSGVGGTEKQLGTAVTGCGTTANGCAVSGTADCVDLSTTLAKYLKSIPMDPNGSASLTKYSIISDTNGIVTIKACGAEGGTNVSIAR